MWSIDVRNLVQNKFVICREYHIQPSEIDRMQYWEYEWYTDEIKEITKEQEKQQKQQEKEFFGGQKQKIKKMRERGG